MIYLDHNATTPCDARVVDAMAPLWATEFANPHSADHDFGRDAAARTEGARQAVAALLGADPREIVFTSGATEANNLAIKGAARFAGAAAGRRRIVTAATEHPCVLETVRALADEGFEPVILPVERDGTLDPERFDRALAVPTLLVSLMAANNETGVLHDLAPLIDRAHRAGALFHTDAAQAAATLPLDVRALGVDLVSLSAHKLYGPKGVGALFVRRRPRVRLAPLFSGGGQERGLRSGTLPAPLVVGFGVAAAIARDRRDGDRVRLAQLRDRLLDALGARIPGLALNGHSGRRLANTLNLRFPGGVDALALLAAAPAIAASTGSACSSAVVAPSTVLTAMGLDEVAARGSLRLGLGRSTSPAEVDRAAVLLAEAWASLAGAASPVRTPALA